jgi:outer membrane protein TolC
MLYVCFCGLAAAQFGAPGPPQSPGQSNPPLPPPSTSLSAGSAQNPFLGGVPSGKATSEVLPLSLDESIDRGLKHNLGLLLGEQGTRSAQAASWRALSSLLPSLNTRTSETSQQINLKAFGFQSFPGIRPIVGPFSVFDTRLYASQSILNFSALNNARAGSENLKAARYSFQDARDVVVLVVTNLYLQAVAGSARIEAARAQLNTAQALYDRAVDRKKAGVIPAIEVLRAQVELQAQQQRLIFFQNEFEKQKLNLARAIGLPVGQQFRLADQIPYAPPPAIAFEDALQQAYRSRADYQSALAQVSAAEAAKKAARAQRLPSLSFDGNYGDTGPGVGDSHGAYAAAISLNIPIFQAGRVRADVLQADVLLQQRKSELENLRVGIDYELRTAFLDLRAAGDQVQVAKSAVDLASQQMTQAQDRFSAGVASNIEVVQAQEALASANENYISSLYAYNAAKAFLARTLGVAEKTARQFLTGAQ